MGMVVGSTRSVGARSRAKSLLRIGMLVLLGVCAAGCSSAPQGPMASATVHGPTVAFDSIDGPPPSIFNRLVQDQRKALNLNISDRIAVSYSASPRVAEAIAAHESYLRHELLAETLEPSATQNGGAKLSLSGEDVFVTITRV